MGPGDEHPPAAHGKLHSAQWFSIGDGGPLAGVDGPPGELTPHDESGGLIVRKPRAGASREDALFDASHGIAAEVESRCFTTLVACLPDEALAADVQLGATVEGYEDSTAIWHFTPCRWRWKVAFTGPPTGPSVGP
ncbi:MAG: hypothetical protein ABI216_12605 [Devosia sp.]